MFEQLSGNTVLVTGATRGIGRAITELFLAHGAKVAGIYHTADERAAELVDKASDNFYPIKFDLANVAEIPSMVDSLPTAFRQVDILVNNAGIKERTSFLDTTPAIWDDTMSINLRAPYFLSQAVARGMAERRHGRIINITSQAGPNLTPDSLEYGTSKTGLAHITKTLAKVLAPFGITVNAISPGRTYTDLTGYNADPEKERRALTGIPLHHINDPAEIADVALFLASKSCANVTGQIIAVDGGEVIR